MTDGVRRLSHEEAEMLISARMDEHLDRADSRALLLHLQTCESCRAFAVQSEVLGRELNALPVLPPSAIVDRQIRESIAKGNKRWSLAGFFPATGGNSGLRAAIGAVAILTLVSVFLLIRMANDGNGPGPAIEAPNGGVAQQSGRTATSELAMAPSGPTETPRVVAPPLQTGETQTAESTASGNQTAEPTQAAAQPTGTKIPQTEQASDANVQPTATLDSAYVYTRDKTRTPTTESGGITPTEASVPPTATEESGGVAVAAIGGEESTPVPPTEEATSIEASPTEPVETPTSDATEVEATATPEQPTEEPATATPSEQPAEPTMTPTPVEISVDATDVPEETATEPPVAASNSDATEEVAVEATSTEQAPVSVPTGTPTSQPSAPSATPEGPFTQPTIAPISGQADTAQIESSGGNGSSGNGNDGGDHGGPSGQGGNDNQGKGQPGNDQGSGSNDDGSSPQIVASDGSDVEAASSTGEDQGSSPPIVSTDATEVPSGGGASGSAGGHATETGVGGESQPEEPTAIPTVDESVEPSGLDLSDTVTELPAGVSSPPGRLEFSPGMNLYVVTAPDGQLAVANLDGELVVTLGGGNLPVWAGGDLMFSSPSDSGSVVGIWDSDSGDLSYVPASEDEASSDVPIGGDGTTFYFLRTFPGRPGMEVHSATSDGSDGGAIWTSDSAALGGDRPVWSSNGILIPTDSSWLLVGTDGSESDLGANSAGYVGAPIVSPGEGLMAYSAGDQVIIAWTEDPGVAVATAPLSGSNGSYAFSTSGEQVVVSDGASLHVVSYEGEDLGTLSGNQPIGGVYWISDTIYYLQIGDDAALMSTSLDAIQGA
jgi:hypothetical protein